MGNHEFNALAYATPDGKGGYLRKHTPEKVEQHRATMEQIGTAHPEEWKGWLEWFATLPLFLDLGQLRAVHAAWDPEAVKAFQLIKKVDGETLRAMSDEESRLGRFRSHLLNGVELTLPEGHFFTNKAGVKRSDIRTRWWESLAGKTYSHVVFPRSDTVPDMFIPTELAGEELTYGADDRLITMVRAARTRLVFATPGVSVVLGKALAEVINSPDAPKQLSVVLDVDAEVCRLGYGTIEGLEAVQRALQSRKRGLQSANGLRIGLLISDDQTLIFSPTPLLIEAGSTAPAKPSAILLQPNPADSLAAACGGSDHSEANEVGLDFVSETRLAEVKADLKESCADGQAQFCRQGSAGRKLSRGGQRLIAENSASVFDVLGHSGRPKRTPAAFSALSFNLVRSEINARSKSATAIKM